MTVAGTSAAMAVQLAVAVSGLTSLMIYLSKGFEWLRWLGVAYLLFLGVRTFTGAARNRATPEGVCGQVRGDVSRGFFVSLTNPKTMLFFAAFLPQFVDPALPSGAQLLLLASSALCLAVVVDATYACLAARLREILARAGRTNLPHRVTGIMLFGTALGLACVRRSQ